MTDYRNIRVARTGGVARITLTRPKHNVFNVDMLKEINAELAALAADEELKCVVILGEGKSWCAGVEVSDHKPAAVHGMIATFGRVFELIEKIEVPVIAAVHGACLGGGMEVAIACDCIIASRQATFGQPEIKLGFLPPYAAIRLPQLVGPAKAIEICTSGKRYSAAEALGMGFISQAVNEEQFAEALEKMVGEITDNSPLIIRLNKRAVKKHIGLGFAEALQGVNDLFLNTLMKTADTLEGISSFEEKRKPQWKNR